MNFILLGLNSAFLTIFINYIIGKPGSDFSPDEIFSSYTVWLSRRRLKRMNLYKEYYSQYLQGRNSERLVNDDAAVYDYKRDFKRVLYNAAEPYFTWERMLGMCVVCFGFWVSLIIAICFSQNFVHCVSIIVISHVTIRIINKLL